MWPYLQYFKLDQHYRNPVYAVCFLVPVSQPHIRRKTVPEEAASELFCDVAVGRMDTIDWKKDGKPLPEDQDFQLSKNHSILIISEGQKLNCGSYSCNVSNEISWQETTLNWAIAGIFTSAWIILWSLISVAVVYMSAWTPCWRSSCLGQHCASPLTEEQRVPNTCALLYGI